MAEVCRVKTSFPAFTELAALDSQDTEDVLVLGLKVSDMNLNQSRIGSGSFTSFAP